MSDQTRPSFTYQPSLRPALPSVYGPQEYRDQVAEYQNMDACLQAGLEHSFILKLAADSGLDWANATDKAQNQFAKRASLCLRCNLAKSLTGFSFRELAIHATDSTLLNWFISGNNFGVNIVPSKSNFQRLADLASADILAELNIELILLASTPATLDSAAGAIVQPFDLEEAISLANIYFDGTCLKSNIHFPVDWVLLRDAIRTLMKATTLIRNAGLRSRMPQAPEDFMSDINRLCMAMSQSRRRKDAKKIRKALLRKMKKLVNIVAAHAQAHLDLLTASRAETNLTEAQANVICERLKNVLTQLPTALKQAHDRIIGERVVPNEDKIFSFYEPAVNCLVRGKANAETEFGNKLWLGETEQGLIIEWKLLQDNQDDSQLVLPSIKELKSKLPPSTIKSATGDRGTQSAANDAGLAEQGIISHLCPRDPDAMAARQAEDPAFRKAQKRRGATEGRIAIIKNVFLGGLVRSKGHTHREQSVGWAVLTHNLVVISDLLKTQRAKEERAEREAKAKAGAKAKALAKAPRQQEVA